MQPLLFMKGEEEMNEDDVKKRTFFRIVEFLLVCIGGSALCLAYFKDRINSYTSLGTNEIIVLGILIVSSLTTWIFSCCKELYYEKILEEEIEKEEE